MQLARANAAALAATPAGIGAIAASFGIVRVVAAVLVGMGVHSFSCVVNALADLEQDRTDPRRQEAALVSGSISPHQAMLSSFLLLLVIVPAVIALIPYVVACGAYLAIVAVQAYGNLFQKCSAWIAPIWMDLLFGVVVAGPIIVFASALGALPDPWLVMLTGSMLLQIAIFNALIGNLKDLRCDIDAGVRTTAIELGVRLGAGDRVLLSRRFARYARLVQGGALVLGVGAVVLIVPMDAVSAIAAAIGLAFLGAATTNVFAATRANGPVDRDVRPWFPVPNYIATIAIAASGLGARDVCALFGAALITTAVSISLSGRHRNSLSKLIEARWD